jgi:hypothetical protein
MGERVTQSANIPPKHGLSKTQQVLSAKHQVVSQDNCPAEEICKKIGNFREGICYKGTSDSQKCTVAVVQLLGRILGDKLPR